MTNCSNNCVTCIFKSLSLFDGLLKSDLDILESNRKSLIFDKGEIIYKEGMKPHELFCLNAGKVKIVKSCSNKKDKQVIVDLKKPVDFIGFNDLLSDSAYQDTAITIEKSNLCVIEKKDLFKVIHRNKDFAKKIICNQANEIQKRNNRLVTLTLKNMESRLCNTLLLLADIYGVSNNGTIKVTLNRSDLANLSNMITANAIRNLSKLVNNGIIELMGKDIRLINIQKIKSIAALN